MPERTPQSARLITVETDQGNATFRRDGPSDAVLEVEYDVPAIEVVAEGAPLEHAVAMTCDYEIARMRETLSRLGHLLASQLDDRGRAAHVRRTWDDRDRRTWRDGGTALHIDGSHTRMTDRMTGYEGASEAGTVREHIRLMIRQREVSIRNVYRQVLADIAARRAGYPPPA